MGRLAAERDPVWLSQVRLVHAWKDHARPHHAVGDAPMAATATAAGRRRPAAGSLPGNGQLDLLGDHLFEAAVSGSQVPSTEDTSR
ncbi:MAG: hypothetical protein ACRD03_09960 [Acidimicrobiales bacterium]